DNNFTVEFDAFGFSVKDFLTRHIHLRCDSLEDLYPVTQPSPIPHALLSVNPTTLHRRLGHLGEEVLLTLVSRQFTNEKSPYVYHACQLGKLARLSFSLNSIITRYFEIVHSDIWTSPIVMPHGLVSRQVDVTLPCSYIDVRIISSVHKEFDMTDLGALNYFLGILFTCDSKGMFLFQKIYALQLLDRGHMANCNPTQTPVGTESKLGSDEDLVSDPSLYRSLAGGLRQHTVSRSSEEAIYRGISNAVAETAWLRNLLRELHTPLLSATLVYCKNVSAVYLTTNPIQHQRTKHIEIDIHFVRDMVACSQVRILHVPSRYQYADIFTKGLPYALFEEFHTSLCVLPSLAQTARKC
nr:ribonuclease H-like domain-containing protein [Tanacetum cinerariifolium]